MVRLRTDVFPSDPACPVDFRRTWLSCIRGRDVEQGTRSRRSRTAYNRGD